MVSIVAPSLIFLYKEEPAQIPHVRVTYYKRAQDTEEFPYNIKVWRSVEMYVKRNEHFLKGASVILGHHALRQTVRPFVDVMSWYMTHIELGRSSNLKLSRLLALKFITYLLYKSYVLHLVFAVSDLIEANNQSNEDGSAIITKVRKLWGQTPIRTYMSEINRWIIDEGSQQILPLVFEVRRSDRNDNVEVSLGVSPAMRRLRPKRS